MIDAFVRVATPYREGVELMWFVPVPWNDQVSSLRRERYSCAVKNSLYTRQVNKLYQFLDLERIPTIVMTQTHWAWAQTLDLERIVGHGVWHMLCALLVS